MQCIQPLIVQGLFREKKSIYIYTHRELPINTFQNLKTQDTAV